jgi:hypothetical protein
MSKSKSSKIEWPTVSQVCEELTWVRDRCCEVPPDALNADGQANDGADEDIDDIGPKEEFDIDDYLMDVRLQVYPNGQWAVRTGDSQYDQDHRGYWGAGFLSWDSDCEELAAALIDEAKDCAAMSGEDVGDENEGGSGSSESHCRRCGTAYVQGYCPKCDWGEEEDEEPTPEDDDLFTDDRRTFYLHRKPVVMVREGEDFWPALLAWMEREGYFPNVWFHDDHGGYTLLERPDDK